MSVEQDVAAILEALRAEVRTRRALVEDAQAPEQAAIERELQHCIEQLEISRVVSAHWPLEGRSPVRRVVNFVNKVVRRLLRWYINPIVEQQNAFNDVSARTLRLLIAANAELYAQLRELHRGEPTTPPSATTSTRVPEEVYLADQAAKSDNGSSTPPDTATLQALIEERGRAEPPAALADLALRPLLAPLAERRVVNAHWPLPGTTLFERIRSFVQRVVRQYLRWYINPIVEQQNSFNAALHAALIATLTADARLRAVIAETRRRR